MATLLDFGLSSAFSTIFSWLLVFVLMFAILEKSKAVSDKSGINGLIAFAVAILFLFVPGVSKILTLSSPWFVLLIFIIFMVVLASMFMGATEADITKAFKVEGIAYWIITIVILIVVGAVGNVYHDKITGLTSATGGEITTAASNDWLTSVGLVILNPKVLGMALIFIIAALAIGRLAAYYK